MARYVYRPRHPWRHGYKREKMRKAAGWLLRFSLAGGALIAAGRLGWGGVADMDLPAREISADEADGAGGDTYGIGVDAGDGTFFWFHRETGTVGKD